MASFRTGTLRKGTIKLKTLRKPGVKDISSVFEKAAALSEIKIGFADEAGLDALLELLDHEHPKIRTLAEEAIANLTKEDGEILVVEGGFKPIAEMLIYKNQQAQVNALWTLAMLAGHSEANHEGILSDVGWQTVLSRSRSQIPEIQRAAVTLLANLSLNEENHDMIINEEGLPLLKTLAVSDDIKLKRAACNAFANLCSDSDNVSKVLGDGGLELIISFLESKDDELIAGALHTLANVASADNVKQNIIKAGGLHSIINLLTSPNVMIQKGAATTISNLAENFEFHKPMVDAGLISPLIFLARRAKKPEVQFRVASSLNSLASNNNMKKLLRDNDAVNPLKALARSRDPDIKREAIEALAELGFTIVGKRNNNLNQSREKLEVDRRSAEKMERERMEKETRELSINEREKLVKESFAHEQFVLQRERMEKESRERQIRERERAELNQLERPEFQRKLDEQAREQSLRETIEKESHEKMMAERALFERQREEADRRAKIERDRLEKQAREAYEALERTKAEKEALQQEKINKEKLERETIDVRLAFERLKAEKESQTSISRMQLEKEAREAREALRRAQQEKEELERTIRNSQSIRLTKNDEIRVLKITEVVEIEDEKDIDEDYPEEDEEITEADKREKAKIALVMVDLWEPSDDISITENAFRKLTVLATKERNRKLIRIAGAIPILVDTLRHADPKVGLTSAQSLALGCLAVLCRNLCNRDEVRHHNGLLIILKFVRELTDDSDLIEALKAAKELSKNDHNKVIFRDGKLIDVLIAKIEKVNQPVQELALDILAIINFNDIKSQVATRDANAIPSVLKLVHSDNNIELKRRATRAIGAIAQNNRKIQQIIRKSSSLGVIVKMLDHPNEECRKTACMAVNALAENDYANQIAIRKLGVVNLLLKILKNDEDKDDMKEDTKEQAAAAIRSLAKSNQKIQSDFRNGPGIPLLVHYMSSLNVGLRIHSTGAIMELARDNPKNCEIICYAGGVFPLVAALDSENKVVQYLSEGAIWALARKSNKRRALFREANAVPRLRKLKMSDHAQVKKGAEWALEVLG